MDPTLQLTHTIATLMAAAPERPKGFPVPTFGKIGPVPELETFLTLDELNAMRSVKARENDWGVRNLWDELRTRAEAWSKDPIGDLTDACRSILDWYGLVGTAEIQPLNGVSAFASATEDWYQKRAEVLAERAMQADASWRREWARRMLREARGLAAQLARQVPA